MAATPLYTVKVPDWEKLDRLPGEIERARHRFVEDLGGELRDAVADKAPGGRNGVIGRSMFADVVGGGVIRIASRHRGAKALDKGAYIRPRRAGGKAIRFRVDGEIVFRRWARIKARRFVSKGLRQRNRVAEGQFRRHFGNLDVNA